MDNDSRQAGIQEDIAPQMVETGLSILVENVESLEAVYKVDPRDLIRLIYSRMREVGERKLADIGG